MPQGREVKINNFRNVRTVEKGLDTDVFAEVDVTTGHLWWRKTVTRDVWLGASRAWWRFLPSGEKAPDTVNELYVGWLGADTLRILKEEKLPAK